MYDIDVYGSKGIIALIAQSKHPRFRIHKAGSIKGGACIFDCNYSTTNEQAQQEFKRWADNIGSNNNAYELYLYSSSYETQKKATTAKAAVKFLFCLNAGNVQRSTDENQRQSTGKNYDAENIAQLITLSIEKALAQREESEISKRLKVIEEQLEEEEEEEINGAGKQSEIMQVLGALSASGLFGGKAPTSAVNGTPEGESKLQRINNAIQRLHKIDPEIDSDLLKLADIGEKNPGQFKFLLNALRGM